MDTTKLSSLQPSELSFPPIFGTKALDYSSAPKTEPPYKQEVTLVPVETDGESTALKGEQQHFTESFGAREQKSAAANDKSIEIVQNAKGDIGQKEWAKGGFDYATLQYGNWGCAASVSNVLTEAGIPVHQASVEGLEADLLHRGWHRVPYSERRPGDVVIMNGGRHTGIVAENTNHAYENSSSARKFVEATYGMNQDAVILTPGK